MVLLVIAILVYIAIGVGLIRLSIWRTKRIRSFALRIAIHTAVFTLWFTPGLAATEGGAMPGPLWLIALDARQKLDHPLVVEMFLACWVVTWIVTLGGVAIWRPFPKKESADGGRKRSP